MGFFDIFKSSKKKQEEGILSNLTNQIFPEGQAQVEQDAQVIRFLLDNRYPLDEIYKAYIHTTIMYSQTMNQDIVVNSVLRQEGCPLSKQDVIFIFNYVKGKKKSDLESSLLETARSIKNGPDGGKLYSAAMGGLFVIQTEYKELTNPGKYEALLFNSLIALRAYGEKYPSRYEEAESYYSTPLVKKAMEYKLMFSPEKLTNFINGRFAFYDNEIHEMLTNKQYLAGKLYNTFYIEPLAEDPASSMDILEIIKFYPALTNMVKWVHDNVKNKI